MSARAAIRRVVAQPVRLALRRVVGARTRNWPPASRLFALGEHTGWSVDEDAAHLEMTARRLGFEVAPSRWARFCGGQSVFHASHFEALTQRWLASSHRLATAYLHGLPGTPGYPEFDEAFEVLRRCSDRLSRVQVTHGEMRDLVLSAGVEPERVHLIRIGIDLEHFPLGDAGMRSRAREALGIPQAAFVVGSFQKDGVGWAEGLEPKLVKGPDVLVRALELLRVDARELFVLLTGPARGYVRRELERRAIPHVHFVARARTELATAFHALDVYLVASRQEGGPKALFEAMATGVPFVTTRVGQAQEVVDPGRNGFVVAVGDSEALAAHAALIREDTGLRDRLRAQGRATAEAHAYEKLDPAWERLLDGFVSRPAADGR